MGTKQDPGSGTGKEYSLDRFFELCPDVLCIAGFDGYFKKINATLPHLLGYSEEEILQRPIDEFIHPEDRNLTSQYRENLRKGSPLIHYENRYVGKDGNIVWLNWTSVPVESDKLVYAIAKNVTHKKKLEIERNSLLTDLNNTNKDLETLTYATTHDLRTPLNNLLSVFSLLDMSKIDDEETLELVQILKSSTEDLKSRFDDYVDILKNKGAKKTITISDINIPAVLEQVSRSMSSLILDSKTTIESEMDENSIIPFNQSYLESIFLNLISNSIKYAIPGIPPKIRIRTSRKDDILVMSFSDNGLGFEMDQVKDKIFGLNQQFHDHKDSKGVGLYLVYNHITSLGGTISVNSEVNKGTTFTMTFKL